MPVHGLRNCTRHAKASLELPLQLEALQMDPGSQITIHGWWDLLEKLRLLGQVQKDSGAYRAFYEQ